MEVWKTIKGFEGLYKISNLGNVFSFKKEGNLKAFINGCGYFEVSLYNNRITKKQQIHSLLASHFLEKPKGINIVIDHINNIKTDNRLENLQYITNRLNTSKDRISKSGFTGVTKRISGNFQAQIWITDKLKNLGSYATAIEASEAYQKALKSLEQ